MPAPAPYPGPSLRGGTFGALSTLGTLGALGTLGIINMGGDDERKFPDDSYSESDSSSLQNYLVKSSLSLFGVEGEGGGGGGGRDGYNGYNDGDGDGDGDGFGGGSLSEMDLSFEASFYSTSELQQPDIHDDDDGSLG